MHAYENGSFANMHGMSFALIVCCIVSDVGAAAGLSVDQRAGWKPTELGLLTHLTWFRAR